MQCKVCNSYIPEGYLYCPVCGNEVIVVSDFEIKLEDNIDMTVVADTLELPKLPSDIQIIDNNKGNNNQNAKKEPSKKTKNQKKSSKSDIKSQTIRMTTLFIGIFLVLGIIGLIIGINVHNYYSFDYQYKKATELIADKDYEAAIRTCKHLVSISDDEKGKILLADCYMAQNNYDAAIAVLFGILDENPDDSSVMEMIISCYEMQNNSKGISDLIQNSQDTNLALKYQDYVSLPPVFSLESGSYVEPDPIKLTSIGDGTIYYTVDGSEPTSSSLEYLGPIPLEPGENTISAIFINEQQIVSEVVTYTYNVELDIPDEPVLLVTSGTKQIPELIGVEDSITKIYYCTGNATPTINSTEYTGPFLMPIGKSSYSFVSINENGVSSDVVFAEYNLNINGSVQQSMAEYAISYQLLSKGEDVSLNTYVTKYGYSLNSKIYYVIEELKNGSATGRKFAVDVDSGELFSFNKNNDNTYSIYPL